MEKNQTDSLMKRVLVVVVLCLFRQIMNLQQQQQRVQLVMKETNRGLLKSLQTVFT